MTLLFWQTAACLMVGAVVQSTLGFGMGVVAIPLMVWNGFTLPAAIGALAPNVLLHTAYGCWQNRADLPWADVWGMCAWRYLSLPLGVVVLHFVAQQGQAVSRGVLGIGLLVLLAIQHRRKTADRQPALSRPVAPIESDPAEVKLTPMARGWSAAAGFGSGFLAGLIGMGGPPLVLWVMQQDWNVRRQRSFLWLSFLLVMPLQFTTMAFAFGKPWLTAVATGFAVTPLVLLVAWATRPWADRWSKQRLELGMRLFLVAIALKMIVEFAMF